MRTISQMILALMGLAILVALTSCSKKAEETITKGVDGDFEVQKLFTHDGCTIYKFYDYQTVYFTNCQGSTRWLDRKHKTPKQKGVN